MHEQDTIVGAGPERNSFRLRWLLVTNQYTCIAASQFSNTITHQDCQGCGKHLHSGCSLRPAMLLRHRKKEEGGLFSMTRKSRYLQTGQMDPSWISKCQRTKWDLVRLPRRSSVPIFEMSSPSITIEPWEASTKRKNDKARVDLPLPVLPTTPIFSRGSMLKLIPCRTGSRSAAYLICRSFTSIWPSCGHWL